MLHNAPPPNKNRLIASPPPHAPAAHATPETPHHQIPDTPSRSPSPARGPPPPPHPAAVTRNTDPSGTHESPNRPSCTHDSRTAVPPLLQPTRAAPAKCNASTAPPRTTSSQPPAS